jgi:hypothetical protein
MGAFGIIFGDLLDISAHGAPAFRAKSNSHE